MKKRILIIGKDHSDPEALTSQLESAGYCVMAAPRDKDALRRLGEAQIDLLVLDITPPEENGRELLDQAVSLFPLVPVILMTSAAEQDQHSSALTVGSGVLLEKPTAAGVLLRTIARLLLESSESRSRRLAVFLETTEHDEGPAFSVFAAVAGGREGAC